MWGEVKARASLKSTLRECGGDFHKALEATRQGARVTLNNRALDAAQECTRQSAIPGGFNNRYTLAVCKYIPKALYGCETAALSLHVAAIVPKLSE